VLGQTQTDNHGAMPMLESTNREHERELRMGLSRKLGPKGQVVIPKNIRDFLNVKPGSEIVFEMANNETIIRPTRPATQLQEEYMTIVTPKLKRKIQLEAILEAEVLEEVHLRGQ